MARVCLLYLGQIRNSKNVLKHLGLSWTNLQKNDLPELRSVEPSFNRLCQAESHSASYIKLDSNFTLTYNFELALNTSKHIVLIMVCQQYKLEF